MKKYLADSLSFGNLCCGALSIGASATGRFEIAMILVFAGALLDGLDGAAARLFGGTRFGVIADDIADGVTYGAAPGAALYFLLSGVQGVVLGITYALFTICRLVYFTLKQGRSDPNYFSGVPSPTGGAIVMSAIVSLGTYPALVGLLTGAACAFMISFDTAYRHLGRLLLYRRTALLYMMPLYLLLSILAFWWNSTLIVAFVLAANLGYALFPILVHFRNAVRERDGAAISTSPR
jgi:CDP-diacylglycerol--serine O-phosphatidyltransferase